MSNEALLLLSRAMPRGWGGFGLTGERQRLLPTHSGAPFVGSGLGILTFLRQSMLGLE